MRWLRLLILWPFDLADAAIRHWPGDLGFVLRYVYYKIRLGHCGAKVRFEPGVTVSGHKHIFIQAGCHIDRGVILIAGSTPNDPRIKINKPNPVYKHPIGQLHIGKHVHVAPYAILVASVGIELENNVAVAAQACIYSISNHHTNTADTADTKRYFFSNRAHADNQCLIAGPITIGAGGGVGMHAILLPGVQILPGEWVKAGAIVLPKKTITK
jgi:acetyltransferase-like isoleucine patch superfamily enzyme